MRANARQSPHQISGGNGDRSGTLPDGELAKAWPLVHAGIPARAQGAGAFVPDEQGHPTDLGQITDFQRRHHGEAETEPRMGLLACTRADSRVIVAKVQKNSAYNLRLSHVGRSSA